MLAVDKDLKYEVKRHRRWVFEGTMRLQSLGICTLYTSYCHLQVKMTDTKGSDLVVTNLRTEEVVPKSNITAPLNKLNVFLR